jgi:YidC/Oxa1 family membrane protein insertase
MTDIRRTLLWVIFSMSLFLIWDAWNRHNGQPSLFGPPPASRTAAATGARPASSLPVPGAVSAVPSAVAPVPGTVAAAPSVAAAPASAPSAGSTVTVTTDLVKATVDTIGGTVVRVELLNQVDPFDPKKHVVLLDRSPDRVYEAETGLVPANGAATLPNHHTPMTVRPGERTLQAGQDQLQLQLESAAVGGVKLVKTYTFTRGSYLIDVRHEIVNEGSAPTRSWLYFKLVRDGNAPPGESSVYSTFTGPAIYTDASKFQKIDFKSIEKRQASDKPEQEITGTDGWIAMVQHYYVSAWLLPEAANPKVTRDFRTEKVGPNLYAVDMLVPLGDIAAGTTRNVDARLYVGPQQENRLAAIAPGLELVKDYGWFTILAKPLFWLLTQLHKLIGNWGWAIVGLVVILKIAFFWLNATAYRSMAKMKAINPRVMEMRERLKDKPQQMQQEMMRIYREEKVNPLGGCLPILVQMPFFIALYWVLLSSVEMRHAPWIGWITDLSAKDPFFILPLLMTGTSLFQVWLNPAPPDPVQAKMMWIMPLAFSVMFFFFPAGLVLYWLTNNLLSIAQQWVINKQLGVAK